MPARFRYSRWDGTQTGFDLDADEALAQVTDDLVYHGDMNAALRRMLQEQGISAEVIPAKTHDEGLAMLEDGATSVYVGDRSILMFLIKNLSKAPEKVLISEDYLTVEPYALALAHGDEDFRLAVDAALSHIFRSNEIITIYDHSFGGKLKRSDLIEALYVISGLPD